VNGPQHYIKAESLLARAEQAEAEMRLGHGVTADPLSLRLAALAHTGLALTAGTVFDSLGRGEWMTAIFGTPEDPDPGRGVT
jgi:hypothetical protein